MIPDLTGLMAAAAVGAGGGFPLLSLLTFLPAAGALLLALTVKEGDDRRARLTALGVMLAAAVPAIAVLLTFDPLIEPIRSAVTLPTTRTVFDATGLQPGLDERHAWLGGQIGSTYHLAVDGTNIWLVMLAVLFGPIAVSAAWGIDKRVKEFFVLLLLLQTAMLGAFLSQDLLLFYAFFEFTLVPGYLLIGGWGGAERKYAASRFFLYTFAGSVLTLGGLLWLTLFYSSVSGRPPTFDIQELYTLLPAAMSSASPATQAFWASAQPWLFVFLLGAFAVKIPLFPFHSWLPISYSEAPTSVTVILAAVLSKMGAFGLLKFVVPLVPHGALAVLPWVVGLAVVGVAYGALVALSTRDLKRLLAYSSLSHMSWMVVGMFALNVEGLGGSLIQMVNHGLATGGLFLIAGFLYERWPTRDIDSFSGLWKSMPVMAFFLILFTLSSVGLPGLNGFVGEFLILAGMFSTALVHDAFAHSGTVAVAGPVYAVLTASGIVLGAWYMFVLLRRLLNGPERFPLGTPKADFGARECATLAPLAVLVLVIGVFPRFFLRPIENSVRGLTEVMKRGGVQVERPQAADMRPTQSWSR